MIKNLDLLNEHLRKIMRQNSEEIKRMLEPLGTLQDPPILKELQKNIERLLRSTEDIAFKNQEAFQRIADLQNHTGLKAFSERLELIGKELTGKLAIDLVSPVLKDIQASLDGLVISEEKFQKALNRLQHRNFVDEFENKVSNLEKGYSTSQGIKFELSEVLAFLMFLLMLFQTLDNSTDKSLEQLNRGQEITNNLIERLIELNANTDEPVKQPKNSLFRLLIANESVPLFVNPSTDSDTLITLFEGQHLDNLEEKRAWFKVRVYEKSTLENKIGWIQKKYVIPEIESGQTIEKKLGDIASSFKGKKPNLIEEKPGDGLIPYVDIQGFEEREFRKYTDGKKCRLCEEGDLLMVWDGSRSGLVGKAPAGAIGSTLAKIEIDGVSNDYGYYYLKSHYQYLNTNPKGSGTPHVDPDLLWNLDIRIPSIKDQYRIVEKIEELFSELDNGVENLKKAQKQLKTYRQAVLKDAFEGKLTKEWREQQDDLPTPEELLQQIKSVRNANRQRELAEWEKEVEQWEKNGKPGRKPRKPRKNYKPLAIDEKVIKVPKHWMQSRLCLLCSDITDGDHQAPPKSDSGYPFITISNINNNEIDFSDTFYVGEVYFSSLKKERKPQKGDVLYTVTGSFGIPVLVNFEKQFCFQRHIGLLRSFELVNQKWLYYLMQSPNVIQQAKKDATGTAQKTVSLTSLRQFIVPFMSEREQKEIVNEIETRLSIVDQLEQTIKENLQKAEALRQSILKKAFCGELVKEELK